jgi:hypothetical protein
VRFRSRTRRRRGRLRARGARRRDVAHRGHRRKRHPTTSPRARRAATASALSAAEPRTRRELSSSERARASRVDPTQPRSRAIARLPSGRAGPPLGASPGVSPGVCAPRGASVASRTEPASGKRRAPRLPTARASANLERLCTGTTAAHHTRPKSRRAHSQTGAPYKFVKTLRKLSFSPQKKTSARLLRCAIRDRRRASRSAHTDLSKGASASPTPYERSTIIALLTISSDERLLFRVLFILRAVERDRSRLLRPRLFFH